MTREEELWVRVSTDLLSALITNRNENESTIHDWMVRRAVEGADKLINAVYEKVNKK